MKLAHLILWIALLGTSVLAQTTTQTLAHWTFESNPVPVAVTTNAIGPITPEIGTGQLRGWHAATNTVWNSTVSGNGSLRALSGNRWAIGDYFEVKVAVPGSGKLGIEWHHTRSSTGPQQFSLQYSTDGNTFFSATNYTLPEMSWSNGETQRKPESVFVYRFPDDHPAHEVTDMTFRLVAMSAPGGVTGTSRIDNVKVTRTDPYLVTVAGQQVEVERWGTGPKGVVFFSHSGDLAADFRANANLVQELAGSEYSVFTWTYPAVEPFNRVGATLSAWINNALPLQDRLLFPGVASSVLAQLREQTGLRDFCLVGNSLGAGVLMSDYDTLVADPHCRMVLVSPTEAFIPLTLPANLENTLMVSDPFSFWETWLRRAEDKEFCARNTNLPLPAYTVEPGHIIISNPLSLQYAFSLVGFAFQEPGTVALLSPETADTFWGNSNAQIRWFASFGSTPVRLELFKGGEFLAAIADSVPNSSCNYWWRVPESLAAADDYAIRISSVGNPEWSGGVEVPFSLRIIPIGNAVDAPLLSWTTGGDAVWYGQSQVLAGGSAAAQSGRITHEQSAWFETTLVGPGTLTFDWRVSSERNYDFLVFSFPETSQRISGEVPWTKVAVEIPAGEVVVRWAYEKDEIVSRGQDTGWVANIRFAPNGETVDEPVIESFSPSAGAPGATVIITGLRLGAVESVRFGGVEASFVSVSDNQITATVPAGAGTGPITVSGPNGEAVSSGGFLLTSLPTAEFAVPTPSSLEGFATMSGAPSAARSITISAAGLRGPLQVTAPPGFEVSRDGVNFGPSVEIAAPPRQDSAANYGGGWAAGSNGGNGFGPWEINVDNGTGQAEAYLGNPAASGVQGMSSNAFALRAGPQNAEASVWTYRSLQRPLAVGEALSFDWGINWDSENNTNGGKGFIIASGSAGILYVGQGGWPGTIRMWHNQLGVDTGIAYGTHAMRWTFRQVDAATLNITATSRTNSAIVALSTNISVPGAVNSFWWYADRMDPDPRRISYYDTLSIQPSAPGGGALEAATGYVRLAAGAAVGMIDGQMQLTSGGEVLSSVSLTGTVMGGGAVYDNWAASYGLDPQGDGAPGADRDGDGHSNWLEFAFGTSPVSADGALVETRTSDGGVTFEFLRRQTDVIYQILHTANLAAAFSTASGPELIVSSDRAGVPEGWEKVSFTVPASGTGFYRIGASPE